MHVEKWHDRFPENDLKGAINFLNSLDWNLSFNQSANKWSLIGGDQRIASFATQEEMEAFIFGMALGLGVLPDEVIDHILRIIRD